MFRINGDVIEVYAPNNAVARIDISRTRHPSVKIPSCNLTELQNYYWGLEDLDELIDALIHAKSLMAEVHRQRQIRETVVVAERGSP